jgi:hypothetical protein
MRKRPFILVAVILGVISALAWQAFQVRESRAMQAQIPKIWMIWPKNGDTVPERPYVAGKVSNPKAAVWLIVHPIEVSDYWVQPQLTVNGDGRWRASIYVGRPGNLDTGKRDEIMAIVNPKRPLKQGDLLRFWPDAESKSEIVEVVRK